MWYKTASLIKLAEAYGSDARDYVFLLLARSLKISRAGDDDDLMLQAVAGPSEKGLSLIERAKIKMLVSGLFNTVHANSFEMNGWKKSLEYMDELAEKYFMNEEYKNELVDQMRKWINEHP